MLSRAGIVLALVLGFLLLPSTAAFACPDGTVPSPTDGGICIPVLDPGTPPDEPPSGPSAPGDHACHREDGSPVDCVTEWGAWSDEHQCWVHPVNVSPTDPIWDGHTDGSIRMCGLATDADPVVMFWMPPGSQPISIDPGVLAQRAKGLLPLAIAQVRTAPQTPDPTYVGIENWLWVPQTQWVTLTKTVTAGNTSVTVTATPSLVAWDVGPETVTCYSAGSVWHAGMTDAARTSCGYSSKSSSESEPGGTFPVSATIRYAVTWTCSGACSSAAGDLGLVDAPTGTSTLEVRQRQTVVIR
ncbi:MAG: hypothetical protein JWO11_1960 [Nocardioides sp.]|nr:hypothetical protein [Nocardioides sp.]